MPSTQTDLLFWVHGEDRGEVMAAVIHINQCLAPYADIQRDVSGFKNRESRDLTGFVDGTTNAKEQQRMIVVCFLSVLPVNCGVFLCSWKAWLALATMVWLTG